MADIIKYDHVVFLQGDDYEEFARILYPERFFSGEATDHDNAVAYLAQWDYGDETMYESAYDTSEVIGLHDEKYETDDYLMSWHHGMSYAGLYRKTFIASEDQLASLVRGYVWATLWSNTYRYEGTELEPYDAYYGGIELDEDSDTYEDLKDDCITFVRENYDALQRVAKVHFLDESDWGQHGHDFALTRNHHGTGFWDRGYGINGDLLTRASDPYGNRSLIVGSNGDVDILE